MNSIPHPSWKELTPKTKGVYAIRNLLDSRVYIGSSHNLQHRKHNNLSNLKCGKHHCRKLQEDWDELGASNFEFQILEIIDEGQTPRQAEARWIETAQACHEKHGYNLLPLDPQGRVIPTQTMRDRSRFIASHPSDETRRKISESQRGRSLTEDHKQKIKDWAKAHPYHTTKRYRLFNPEGDIVDIRNLKRFCRENGLSDTNLIKVANGKKNHYRGWRCQRLKEEENE